MRKLMILCVCVALAALTGSSQVMAGEKASTAELPAALQAIGVDQSKILSQDEAEQVRGEHFVAAFQIDFITVNFATRVAFTGTFDLIAIEITTGGIALLIL